MFNPEEAILRVGVVGLGLQIGSGVARALHNGGFHPLGYDQNPARLAACAAFLTAAGSTRELANAVDVLFVAVFDDSQVREVLEGAQGVFSAARPPRVVVVLSTVTLATVRWAAEAAAAHGVAILDCGVAGGRGLDNGKIVAMVGGNEQEFDFARPALETFGSPLAYMGRLGSGMRTKLARNLIHYCSIAAAWEGVRLVLAGDSGIDLAKFVEIVRARDRIGTAIDSIAERKGSPVEFLHAPIDKRFAAFAHKDLAAALELADELGLDLGEAKIASELYRSAQGGADR